MIFTETKLEGAYIVTPEPLRDERGFFARTWCQREFAAHGLNSSLAQCSISFSERKGTLRGLHFQMAPYQETKLVRVTAGAIFCVIVDLRPDSPTFTQYLGHILTACNRQMLYVPEGFAQGFQTLEDHTEVLYQISEFYVPESARGVRWNDPAFHIEWPPDDRIIATRDQSFPDFNPADWARGYAGH